jgi:hypothetical protein
MGLETLKGDRISRLFRSPKVIHSLSIKLSGKALLQSEVKNLPAIFKPSNLTGAMAGHELLLATHRSANPTKKHIVQTLFTGFKNIKT